MRDYVTLFAFDADGPYYTAGLFEAGHAEAAIDKARAVCAARLSEQPTLFVATPARNWTANCFEEQLVTRRHEAAVPADPAGIRQAARDHDGQHSEPGDGLAEADAMTRLEVDAGYSVQVPS